MLWYDVGIVGVHGTEQSADIEIGAFAPTSGYRTEKGTYL